MTSRRMRSDCEASTLVRSAAPGAIYDHEKKRAMIWFKSSSKVILGIRLALAAVFLMYGSVKLFGGQYFYDWAELLFRKPEENGTSFVWAFYG